MSKALVEVIVPGADQTFDVYIPLASPMNEVLGLLSRLISSLTQDIYKADGAVLCDAVTGTILDVDRAVAELGIRNGSRLLLI